MLSKVALPTGELFYPTAASYYLLVEGGDGYRAVFAWAELDSTSWTSRFMWLRCGTASRCRKTKGPFELVVPGEKRNSRWVRQAKLLRVEPLPTTTAYDAEQARWIVGNLPEMESIKIGMTRKELLKVFMEEGGLSTRQWRQYVYRRCGYVKVEVEFAPAGDPNSVVVSSSWRFGLPFHHRHRAGAGWKGRHYLAIGAFLHLECPAQHSLLLIEN